MEKQKRIRDYGYDMGRLPTGPLNKLTDVPGVRVGHCTVLDETHRTGVTVILPSTRNVYRYKLPAAGFVLNGYGKTMGLVQVEELGTLETPIALTNTLNVGLVADALVEYTVERCAAEGLSVRSLNPLVGECNDGTLSNIAVRAVGKPQFDAAVTGARADFAEGAVGAGTGMICHELKGGIGSASRVLQLGDVSYTVGVLVLANHGQLDQLMLGGENIGPDIQAQIDQLPRPQEKGSCIMVLATDLPLTDRQLHRVIKRCGVGLARVGSYWGHGSGDIAIGFSTANAIDSQSDAVLENCTRLREDALETAFLAAAEATAEAVLNALTAAVPMTGWTGKQVHSLAEFL